MTEQTIKLWKNGAPLYDAEKGLPEPYFKLFFAENAKPDAPFVIICPGGAYIMLADGHEGADVARRINQTGVHAAVLYYRYKPYHDPVMKYDALRAVRFVRAHAAEWQVDPQKIGILGFSAGANFASLALTQYDSGRTDADADDIDRCSSRPDFAVLCYGVLSLDDSITHWETKANLVGDADADALTKKLTTELNIRDDCPPVFLWHSEADTCVPVENALVTAAALNAKKIPFELHIFPHGNHGIGMGSPSDRDEAHCGQWVTLLERWMKDYIFGTI